MLDKTSEGDARLQIGANNPPGPIELAGFTISDVSAFLKDNPTIADGKAASEAKILCDRAKAALEEIEAERDGKVRPLNDQVKAINEQYKALHNTDAKKPGTFDRIFAELKARVAAYLLKVEAERIRVAEEAAAKAAEAERLAREAERLEADAKENAAAGELDVDVVAAVQQADETFSEFERASRFAARAERDTKVKLGGGFGRAATLRTAETLHLDSYNLAIKAIGPNDKIRAAILSAAREYRETHGVLPAGVSATTERKL